TQIKMVIQLKKLRTDTLRTRLSLLMAASEIFAKKGFWNATFEEICHKADTNVASINYHFGSKENLYIETWKYTFEKSMKKHPPNGNALPTDPPEKRIRGRIISILERIVDPEDYDFEIVHKEVSNPTGLLFDVFSKTIEPIDNAFKELIREYLGEGASDELVDFCFNSILSLCFMPMLHLRVKQESPPIPTPSLNISNTDIEKLTDYFIQFIFNGINSFCQKK
ncbi:MAG: TetR/AcrR family transcriptional regulator, partial [Deltaproteobacteria bacterium]|nr:TetR/AcrR family transcriptional regulator [Deltaproteobacteria bacterium]